MEILSMDPSHDSAKQGADRIKTEQVAAADQALESGKDLEALKILSVLSNADTNDKDLKKKYTALKDRLNEERAETLRTSLEELYATKQFDDMVSPFKELEQITPGSKFINTMRKNLVKAFDTRSQSERSRKKYGEAHRSLQLALDLNPDDKKINASMSELKEEKLLNDIQKKTRALENAISANNYKDQHRLAKDLDSLNPGDATANMALDEVEKAISDKIQDAESAREKGQFKLTAKLYKEVWKITGDEDARTQMVKYQQWAPPPRMSFIPVGSFSMGNNQVLNAHPQHKVSLSNYFIDQFEVTNRLFQEFVKANPQWHPARISSDKHDGNYLRHWATGAPAEDDLDRPVTYVSWFAARAYATWKGNRLPTEAEWERAARGHSTDKKFWWGNFSDAKKAVYDLYPEKKPAYVGTFPANDFEIHEILGNVAEWVEDTYDPDIYDRSKGARDPVNQKDGSDKVLRGGSYRSRGRDLAVYLRYYKDPRFCHSTVGFRCARDAGSEP